MGGVEKERRDKRQEGKFLRAKGIQKSDREQRASTQEAKIVL